MVESGIETPIDALARAFVVEHQGAADEQDTNRLRDRFGHQGITGDEEVGGVLARAQAWFRRGSAHLFVCGGRPCRERSRDFAGVMVAVEAFGREVGRAGSMTECQGPCSAATVVTLRVGDRCAVFARVHEPCDWQAVLGYAERAARSGTLLVDPGTAQPFLFDPVHEPTDSGTVLRRLAFLVGHVSGHGRYATRPGAFHKEVVGSWEAGGRFIALRMAATYPLTDGRKDVHQALVLIGFDEASGSYAARAYTDSGTTRDYDLILEGDRVVFADRVPEHEVDAARARKVLVLRPGGYDESLEVQAEGKPFRLYSMVELRHAVVDAMSETPSGHP